MEFKYLISRCNLLVTACIWDFSRGLGGDETPEDSPAWCERERFSFLEMGQWGGG
jgi:hypothetical protein